MRKQHRRLFATHGLQDHVHEAHAGSPCVSCGRALFMFALRLMTGRLRRPVRAASQDLRKILLARRSLMVWHHDILVQDGRVGAPLARTACHVMRDEPFSFPPTRPFMGVLWSWHSGVFEGTLLRGSGALGSYPPLATAPPYASCMHRWCIAGLLHPGSSPGGPRTPLRSRGCWGEDALYLHSAFL